MTTSTRDIGKYRNAELISQGGFGSVYRAVDHEHGRAVAVKVLSGRMGETECRRFDRERQTMGRLSGHPNIVPIYDSGYTDQGEAYIVMELATGGSLRDRMATTGVFRWPEAVAVMAPIAAATQMAHDHGVLHRDIKPDNILIDQFGNPKLSDFGIAAVANNATATTSTTATLAHAAPEILQGRSASVASDVYAVGSTLYNLITGYPPFLQPGDEGVTPMITRALSAPPPDLRRYGVPDAVARVVEQALAKAPEARQATAGQLAADLVAALGGNVASSADVRTVASPAPAPVPPAAYTQVTGPPVFRPAPAPEPQTVTSAPTVHRAPQWDGPPAGYAAGGIGIPPGPGVAAPVAARPSPSSGASRGSSPLLLGGLGLMAALAVGGLAYGLGAGNNSNPPTSTTASTASVTTATTPAAPTSTVPRSTTTDQATDETSFTGFTADTAITWDRGGGDVYTAGVVIDGATGVLVVEVPDPSTGLLVEVHEDLTLASTSDGQWVYYGSNPTLLDGEPLPDYDPDWLIVDQDSAGWYLSDVCDSAGCYPIS